MEGESVKEKAYQDYIDALKASTKNYCLAYIADFTERIQAHIDSCVDPKEIVGLQTRLESLCAGVLLADQNVEYAITLDSISSHHIPLIPEETTGAYKTMGYHTLGHLLFELRKQHSKNTREMASIMKISTNTLSKLENNQNSTPLKQDRLIRQNVYRYKKRLIEYFDLEEEAVMDIPIYDPAVSPQTWKNR